VLAIGLTAAAVLGACTSADDGTPAAAEPSESAVATTTGGDVRSVIFVSGDGMAAAHREAGRLDQAGFDGRLAMGSLPVSGLQTTDPLDPDDTVTDSAAAASAWATGQKTYNGAISVDVDGEPLPTLGVEAAEAGRATGLVTTTAVTDASPAAFFSNAEDRDEQRDIARQYLADAGPDVVLGGGGTVWNRDLRAEAEDAGYTLVTDADELAAAEGDRLLGLFADDDLYRDADGDADVEEGSVVPLADLTSAALDVLGRDPDGFFLFVEEEAVDSMSHANDGDQLLAAMRSLDAAVAVAREYVVEHPGTLLVVTGDHDAGGLAVEDGDEGRDSFDVAGSDRDFTLDWTTTGHTGAPVPVTAEGPGSALLAGSYPNTHLHEVLRRLLLG
jgi:alkaline phosphatase